MMSVGGSRRRLQACVAKLCANPEYFIQEFQGLSATALLDHIRAHLNHQVVWRDQPYSLEEQITPEQIRSLNVVGQTNVLTFQTANVIMWFLTNFMKAEADLACIKVVVETLVALAKQGQANDNFLAKIQDGLKADLNIDISLEIDNIKSIFQTFGRNLDPNSARYLCRYLNSLIPNAALRVSLTLQQAAGSGLSAFMLINQIIVSHPEFKWATLAKLFPLVWTAYQKAIDRVANDIWFGYSQDKGVAASKNYVSLFYACSQLVIKADGLTTWRAYGGGKAGVRHKAKIDALVSSYLSDSDDIPDNIPADVWNAVFDSNNSTMQKILAIDLLDRPLDVTELNSIRGYIRQSDPEPDPDHPDVIDTPLHYMG